MVDIREEVKTAMRNVLYGEFGQDIAYAIAYVRREYINDRYKVPGTFTYSDVLISALDKMLLQTRLHVTKWDSKDIYYWQKIVDVMKKNDIMLQSDITVDLRLKIKKSIDNVMDGVFGKDIAVLIDSIAKNYNYKIWHYHKIIYEDVLISALYQLMKKPKELHVGFIIWHSLFVGNRLYVADGTGNCNMYKVA